jgi:hypothetical protein
MSGNDPKPPAHGGSSGSSPTVAIDEVAAVKASPAETVDETVNAYEDAKNGGHFAQYLERYRTLPTRQLLAERTELMKAIGESERALRDPERWGHMAHDPDFMDTLFGGLNDRIKMDTIWKNIIDGVLRERGATEPS